MNMADKSDGLENLRAILKEKFSDTLDAEVQALVTKLTIAAGNGSVAVNGDATEAVIITGNQNIVGSNNRVVINQGTDRDELVKILGEIFQSKSDYSDQPILELLKECTVRIDLTDNNYGTGFFIAPGLILTCYTFVKQQQAKAGNSSIKVFWKGQTYSTSVAKVPKEKPEKEGFAILKLSTAIEHQYVGIGKSYSSEDNFISYGYSKERPNGQEVVFGCVESNEFSRISLRMKGKFFEISGAPLLNQRTQKVCGFLASSSLFSETIAIPIEAVLEHCSDLVNTIKSAQELNRIWKELLPAPITYDSLDKEYAGVYAQLQALSHCLWKEIPEAKHGLQGLKDALNSDSKEIKTSRLNEARQKFKELIALKEEKSGEGKVFWGIVDQVIDKKFLEALGFWGLYKIDFLLGELRNSTNLVYSFTERNPDIGIKIFPSKFFSKDYSQFIKQIEEDIEKSQSRYRTIRHHTTANFYLLKAGKIAGAAGVLGLGAADFIMSEGSRTHNLMSSTRAATKLWNAKVPKPKDEEINQLIQNIEQMKLQLENYLAEIKLECQNRIRELNEDE